MTDAISRFPVLDPVDVPDDLRKVMEENLQKAMRGASGLSRAEREMIVVAVSAANSCAY